MNNRSGMATRRLRLMFACLLLLPVAASAQKKATTNFAGLVIDSLKRPIANAEVALPGLSMRALTNDKGEFRLLDITAGVHQIVVRHIGYGQLDTVIAFPDSGTVERRVTLGRIVTLDSVEVTVDARVRDPLMVEFEENRARGFGRFLGRTDLDKMEGRTLGNLMTTLSGLEVVRGNQGQAWIAGKRAPMSRCPPTSSAGSPAQAAINQANTDRCLQAERVFYVPERFEQAQGMKRVCYALVFLDRALMNSGRPTPPFDLNTFAPGRLEAIEWYESAAQTPPRFNGRDAACGVAVLHTRRNP